MRTIGEHYNIGEFFVPVINDVASSVVDAVRQGLAAHQQLGKWGEREKGGKINIE
jgi:hypothetical protein